jgi:hypothetical protein
MDNLVVVDALAVPITTPSCRTQRPSTSCGITPQPTANGIEPQTAFTSRRRPPTHMESAAPSSLPRIGRALIPIVGAATLQRLFFFNLTLLLTTHSWMEHKEHDGLALYCLSQPQAFLLSIFSLLSK